MAKRKFLGIPGTQFMMKQGPLRPQTGPEKALGSIGMGLVGAGGAGLVGPAVGAGTKALGGAASAAKSAAVPAAGALAGLAVQYFLGQLPKSGNPAPAAAQTKAGPATSSSVPGMDPDPRAVAYFLGQIPKSGDQAKDLASATALALQHFPPPAIQQLKAEAAMAAQGWTPADLQAVAKQRAAFTRQQGGIMAGLQEQLAAKQAEYQQGTPFEGIAGTGQLANLTRQLAEIQAAQDMDLPARLVRQSMGQQEPVRQSSFGSAIDKAAAAGGGDDVMKMFGGG